MLEDIVPSSAAIEAKNVDDFIPDKGVDLETDDSEAKFLKR